MNLHNQQGIFPFCLIRNTCTQSERTKQMEPILRAKVKIFFKSENFKKMLLIKNDGHLGFIQDKKKLGWLSSFVISL